jgi:hypothetical protein
MWAVGLLSLVISLPVAFWARDPEENEAQPITRTGPRAGVDRSHTSFDILRPGEKTGGELVPFDDKS